MGWGDEGGQDGPAEAAEARRQGVESVRAQAHQQGCDLPGRRQEEEGRGQVQHVHQGRRQKPQAVLNP